MVAPATDLSRLQREGELGLPSVKRKARAELSGSTRVESGTVSASRLNR